MVQKHTREAIAENAIVHEAPPVAVHHVEVDRSFELPRSLYAATVACYLSFLLIMGLCFATPSLILPMAIFAFIIIAGFGVPTIWTRLAHGKRVKALSWARFRRDGIATITGRNTASQATVQVLILPALILVWGMAVVTIAAIVR